ncbi:hypothetical protein A3Q56_05047 [Intoshia linei]|uniref:Uncharacterized protein n=1 Tax=Intoshia linei TaxID=1819745 RepID=A0A177AYY9_9BILA|nr:hypothetical protein A3Q56_05047 [Intoshia linei]
MKDSKESFQCSQSAVIFTTKNKPPSRISSVVVAYDPLSKQTLQADVTIDKIHKIYMETTTRHLFLQDTPEKFSIKATDVFGNTFTSLEGIPFRWFIKSKNVNQQVIRILDFTRSSYIASEYIKKAENSGIRTDKVLIVGISSSSATIVAHVDDILYKNSVEPINVKLNIVDKLAFVPDVVYLLIFAIYRPRLKIVKGSKDVTVEQICLKYHYAFSAPTNENEYCTIDNKRCLIITMDDMREDDDVSYNACIIQLRDHELDEGYNEYMPSLNAYTVSRPVSYFIDILNIEGNYLTNGTRYELKLNFYTHNHDLIHISENIVIQFISSNLQITKITPLNKNWDIIQLDTIGIGTTDISVSSLDICDIKTFTGETFDLKRCNIKKRFFFDQSPRQIVIHAKLNIQDNLISFPPNYNKEPYVYHLKVNDYDENDEFKLVPAFSIHFANDTFKDLINYAFMINNDGYFTSNSQVIRGPHNIEQNVIKMVIKAYDDNNYYNNDVVDAVVAKVHGISICQTKRETLIHDTLVVPIGANYIHNGTVQQYTQCHLLDFSFYFDKSLIFEIVKLEPVYGYSDGRCLSLHLKAIGKGEATLFVKLKVPKEWNASNESFDVFQSYETFGKFYSYDLVNIQPNLNKYVIMPFSPVDLVVTGGSLNVENYRYNFSTSHTNHFTINHRYDKLGEKHSLNILCTRETDLPNLVDITLSIGNNFENLMFLTYFDTIDIQITCDHPHSMNVYYPELNRCQTYNEDISYIYVEIINIPKFYLSYYDKKHYKMLTKLSSVHLQHTRFGDTLLDVKDDTLHFTYKNGTIENEYDITGKRYIETTDYFNIEKKVKLYYSKIPSLSSDGKVLNRINLLLDSRYNKKYISLMNGSKIARLCENFNETANLLDLNELDNKIVVSGKMVGVTSINICDCHFYPTRSIFLSVYVYDIKSISISSDPLVELDKDVVINTTFLDTLLQTIPSDALEDVEVELFVKPSGLKIHKRSSGLYILKSFASGEYTVYLKYTKVYDGSIDQSDVEKFIVSNSLNVEVFSKLRVDPQDLILSQMAIFQVKLFDGPKISSRTNFTCFPKNIIQIDDNGLVTTGTATGRVTVEASVYRQFVDTFNISTVSFTIHVIDVLSDLKIYSPLNKIYVNHLQTLEGLYQHEKSNIFALSGLNSNYLEFQWNLSNDNVFFLNSVDSNVQIIKAIKPGKSVVHFSIIINGKTVSTSLDILIVDPFTYVHFITCQNFLMSPASKLMLDVHYDATDVQHSLFRVKPMDIFINRMQQCSNCSLKLKLYDSSYYLVEQEGIEDNYLLFSTLIRKKFKNVEKLANDIKRKTQTKSEFLKNEQNVHDASVISTLIYIRFISFMQIEMDLCDQYGHLLSFRHRHTTTSNFLPDQFSSKLKSVPLGFLINLNILFFDIEGFKFDATSQSIIYRLSRSDIVSVKDYSKNIIKLEALSVGSVIIRVCSVPKSFEVSSDNSYAFKKQSHYSDENFYIYTTESLSNKQDPYYSDVNLSYCTSQQIFVKNVIEITCLHSKKVLTSFYNQTMYLQLGQIVQANVNFDAIFADVDDILFSDTFTIYDLTKQIIWTCDDMQVDAKLGIFVATNLGNYKIYAKLPNVFQIFIYVAILPVIPSIDASTIYLEHHTSPKYYLNGLKYSVESLHLSQTYENIFINKSKIPFGCDLKNTHELQVIDSPNNLECWVDFDAKTFQYFVQFSRKTHSTIVDFELTLYSKDGATNLKNVSIISIVDLFYIVEPKTDNPDKNVEIIINSKCSAPVIIKVDSKVLKANDLQVMCNDNIVAEKNIYDEYKNLIGIVFCIRQNWILSTNFESNLLDSYTCNIVSTLTHQTVEVGVKIAKQNEPQISDVKSYKLTFGFSQLVILLITLSVILLCFYIFHKTKNKVQMNDPRGILFNNSSIGYLNRTNPENNSFSKDSEYPSFQKLWSTN